MLQIQVGIDKLVAGASVLCTTKSVLHDNVDCLLLIASGILPTNFSTHTIFKEAHVEFPVPHFRNIGRHLVPFLYVLNTPATPGKGALLEYAVSVAAASSTPAEDEATALKINFASVSMRQVALRGSVNRTLEVAVLDLLLGAINTHVEALTYNVSMLLRLRDDPALEAVNVKGIAATDYTVNVKRIAATDYTVN